MILNYVLCFAVGLFLLLAWKCLDGATHYARLNARTYRPVRHLMRWHLSAAAVCALLGWLSFLWWVSRITQLVAGL